MTTACLRCGSEMTVFHPFQRSWHRCDGCGLQWTTSDNGGGVEEYFDRVDGEWQNVPLGVLPVFGEGTDE